MHRFLTLILPQYRSDSELKIVGEYGLRNKREVWRVQLTLSKIRRAARYVLFERLYSCFEVGNSN